MNASRSRTVAGSFAIHELGSNVWQLATGADAGPEIYLVGADSDAARIARDTNISTVELEWRDSRVLVTLTSIDGSKVLQARAALVHEPFARLYQNLPLAQFDSAARRFWRRVFRLVRIPGGRHLLRFMARRRRRES
ncbi:MAG TPA: hypothetical protein VK251_00945 [Steroidobacteraceae bacterium]|nr:hypothetical protein [Steroidobacteraceae bacterium]